jgi:hypothetical protein
MSVIVRDMKMPKFSGIWRSGYTRSEMRENRHSPSGSRSGTHGRLSAF